MPKRVEIKRPPEGLEVSTLNDRILLQDARKEALKILDQVESEQIAKNIHFFINNPFPLGPTGKGRACMTVPYGDESVKHISDVIHSAFTYFQIPDIDEKIKRCNIIVRRYRPGMSIPFHVDDLKCESSVIGIILENKHPHSNGLQLTNNEKVFTMEEHIGTIFCMDGKARYAWKHGLPPVTHERISVTCRVFKEDVYNNYHANAPKVEEVDDTSEEVVIQDVNVDLVLNTNRTKTKTVKIKPFFDMKAMVKLAKNKFRFKPKIFYGMDGTEYNDGDLLEKGDKIYVSKGERYVGSTINKKKIKKEKAQKLEDELQEKYRDTRLMQNSTIRKIALNWRNSAYASIKFMLLEQTGGRENTLKMVPEENAAAVGEFLKHNADLSIPEFREVVLNLREIVDNDPDLSWYVATESEHDRRTVVYVVEKYNGLYYWLGFEATADKAVKGKAKRDGPLWALDGGINNPAAKRTGTQYQLKRGTVTTESSFMFAGSTWPSTYHTCKITVDGVDYTSAAQYVMAEQAKLFGDDKRYKEIMDGSYDPSPHKLFDHKAPKTGVRQVANFDPAIWEKHGPNIMYKATFEKYRQNPDLRAKLLETGKKTIIEGTDDPQWGIGLPLNHPDALRPKKWKGENKMGQLLETIREKLK